MQSPTYFGIDSADAKRSPQQYDCKILLVEHIYLSNFSLLDVQRYLKNENWSILNKTSQAIVFSGPKTDSGRSIIFRLPASEGKTDYFERINDLINIFSAIKKTDQQEIIRQISLMNHDIFRVRILNPCDFKFSIPLDVAASEVDALKNLFVYAASSEVKPRPFFDRPLSNGIKYANQCQFGHTFEGSFGFTINTPINLPDHPQLLFDGSIEIPFERKVTERIIQGFINIDKAIEAQDINIIVDNFENGLNSKMCESLIELSIEKSKHIEFAIGWSPRLKTSKQISHFSTITMEEPTMEVIEEAAGKLKYVEPFKEVIIGPIVTLHSIKEPFSDEEFTRIAIIKHEFDGRRIEVKLELNKSGYEVAYKAHGEGKTVYVEGKLFKKGSTWRMIDITDIKIVHS